MEISLLQEAMIEHAKFGKQKLEIFFIHSMAIKMQFIQWHLMFLMGIIELI